MINSFNFTNISILVVLLLSVCVLLFYYFYYFLKLGTYKIKAENNVTQLPVSIIIAARNEYANLEKNLKSILEQDYPDFEVIVVNDCSWDESQKLLEYYQEVYPHLRICELKEQEKYPTGKKFALTMGIKAASNNNLIFTDADCKPASNQWLALMASKYNTEKQLVLGFSPYTFQSGFINLIARFESAITAMLYFSAAIHKNAFMGVGRNLGYTKELFFKQKGFAWHQHLISGDDDLFVNRAATTTNVAIQIDPASFVYTESKKNFSDWFSQKTRHNATGKFYKPSHKAFLGTFYAANLFFYASIIALLIVNFNFWKIVLVVYFFKLISQSVVYFLAFKKLKHQNLTWFILVLDILFVIYIYLFGTIGLFAKQRKMW
ncbi:MAG: glycosyltransferase [Bacteroidia bacterium]|nr:glycosyltransferase [Bacteroidia bacterium]